MEPSFSTRTTWNLEASSLTVAIGRSRAAGSALIDLTQSNPTKCGFHFYTQNLLAPLSHVDALVYDPEPTGMVAARVGVTRYYADHEAVVAPGDVILTTSTSEAYSFLFRLLCDPGDEILVAQPGYPLFDFLATIDDVNLRTYPLFFDFGWCIDLAELERRITARTRAILLVHPNNPTGHATSAAEREKLQAICERHGLALIVDEVFLDYALKEPINSFAAGASACLTFVVSGLSKIAALPQMKVGWIVLRGPEALCKEAAARLEVVADTFLSMNAPIQLALPEWLARRVAIQEEILARVRKNLSVLTTAKHLRALPVDAGWSAILELPQRLGSELLAEQLVEEAAIVVHPGSFYSLAGDHRVVVSLIGPTDEFECGIVALDRWCSVGMTDAALAI